MPGPSRRPARASQTNIALVAALTAIALLPGLGTGSSAAAPARDRPNVLIIVTDDQREGLGVMPTTKRLMGAEGVRYPNAFATTPVCCPSRASIFTGRYAHNHRVVDNYAATALDQETTLQYYLGTAGYKTALFGKYLNGWPRESSPPYFDEFATAGSFSYYNAIWNVNGVVQEIPEYSTTYIGDLAVDFIERAAAERPARPWLLYLTTPALHEPYVAEERYRGLTVPEWRGNPAVFESDFSDKPPYVREMAGQPTRSCRDGTDFECGERVRRKQLRTLMSVDDMIERVLGRLEGLGQSENTLVFFVSDNGMLWSEHSLVGKFVPYLQSVRVPMFMRWPGTLSPRADRRLVANIDIAPTVLDATRVTLPGRVAMDGRSLLDTSWRRDRMLTEYFSSRNHVAPECASLMTGSLHYVEYYAGDGTLEFQEYYDLATDPWEKENLLSDRYAANDPAPDGVAALSALLAEDRRCAGASCP